ncbi:hypothetical protein EDC19_2367 [Natranaerovirga hydrolytica]|uniref:Uncharacterized protein n=1 Tax=Natranaerovirga hydrolytica TaxID=680378 RepID=A0A4R1MDJ7_9FIRM|nr:hypothetical protein [Natranaerovirga hydrolytica]TCK90598.1 hypothetical protein EDC19_2367 [Natranaerovirga hydrolytica]
MRRKKIVMDEKGEIVQSSMRRSKTNKYIQELDLLHYVERNVNNLFVVQKNFLIEIKKEIINQKNIFVIEFKKSAK